MRHLGALLSFEGYSDKGRWQEQRLIVERAVSRCARRQLAAGARRRRRRARGLGEGVGPRRASPRLCRAMLHLGRRALPAHACGRAHRPDGRVLLGGGGLAAAAPRRAGDCLDPVDGLLCVFSCCRGRLWFMGCRHSLAAAHLHLADRVARVRDSGLSGSGARLKIVISQPWRVGNRSRLVAGWPDGAAAALSAPSLYLQPLLVAGWYRRRTKRNRLL